MVEWRHVSVSRSALSLVRRLRVFEEFLNVEKIVVSRQGWLSRCLLVFELFIVSLVNVACKQLLEGNSSVEFLLVIFHN